ncbi:PA2169 family four-helix-bundle protein [Mucilaginibacter myungsuensis]|uniref:PA2169 family four-helix-bundle protein n=1 Tax=Mucilaginibacter myungsuensis TaxID=649104 RepID=A0A929L5Y1_9SPHI|nr:PA2169 family four-helix-bundle protein [Mucilaginibacter myungsuensis]MBE9664575.1 PA2169 family four-helix-bundle protein [Mucilaginibacter myungsuensis]MDN3601075.1 PA2169 family four-helix-bundle protein [Mucilaginibacter myungsuensis]
MENTTNTTIEDLNDLIQIHNDRIKGYENAMADLKESDGQLKSIFVECISESHQFKLALATEVAALGGDIETGTTLSGKLYRTWMSVRDAFGKTNKSVLASCEFGEDAAQKAYLTVLQDEGLPSYLQSIIINQQSQLKVTHDKIKALRDME